ncbi:MAG TPA: hypothetical protein VK465_03210 [Fibrobacteria bacterium]|nr:hypothetical protein [Fibrobacteria bacterium]
MRPNLNPLGNRKPKELPKYPDPNPSAPAANANQEHLEMVEMPGRADLRKGKTPTAEPLTGKTFAVTYASHAPDMEVNDFAQQFGTIMRPVVKEYAQQLAVRKACLIPPTRGGGAAGRDIVVDLPRMVTMDFLAVFKSGMHKFVETMHKEGLKVPHTVTTLTFAEALHVQNKVFTQTYQRKIRDQDSLLNASKRETRRLAKEEREFIVLKNTKAYVENTLAKRVRDLDKDWEEVLRTDLYPNPDYLKGRLDKAPFGKDLHAILLDYREERKSAINSRVEAFCFEDGTRLKRGNGKETQFTLEGMHGNQTVELRCLEKEALSLAGERIARRELELYLGGQQVDLGADAWKTLRQYYSHHTLSKAFGDGARLQSASMDEIIGHIRAEKLLDERIAKITESHIRDAYVNALESTNAKVQFGTGYSYNKFAYGENYGHAARAEVVKQMLGVALEGKVFLQGSCGFQQDLLFTSGGHMISRQDLNPKTGATYIHDPHGNDPYTIEEKPTYVSLEPHTASAGDREKPIGERPMRIEEKPLWKVEGYRVDADKNQAIITVVQKDTATIWKPRDYAPMTLPLAETIVESPHVDSQTSRSIPLRYGKEYIMAPSDMVLKHAWDGDGDYFSRHKDVPLNELSNIDSVGRVTGELPVKQVLDPRLVPGLQSLEWVHTLKTPLREEGDGALVLDAHGHPVTEMAKLVMEPKRDANGNLVRIRKPMVFAHSGPESELRIPPDMEISRIEKWVRVPKRDGNGEIQVDRNGQVLCTYEKKVQHRGGVGEEAIDPSILVDRVYAPINCVHSQNGVNIPHESEIMNGHMRYTGYSVPTHADSDGPFTSPAILAGHRENNTPHPVLVPPGSQQEKMTVENAEIIVGNGTVVGQISQHHSDMIAHEGMNALNPYYKGMYDFSIPPEAHGRKDGKLSALHSGDNMDAYRSAVERIKTLRDEPIELNNVPKPEERRNGLGQVRPPESGSEGAGPSSVRIPNPAEIEEGPVWRSVSRPSASVAPTLTNHSINPSGSSEIRKKKPTLADLLQREQETEAAPEITPARPVRPAVTAEPVPFGPKPFGHEDLMPLGDAINRPEPEKIMRYFRKDNNGNTATAGGPGLQGTVGASDGYESLLHLAGSKAVDATTGALSGISYLYAGAIGAGIAKDAIYANTRMHLQRSQIRAGRAEMADQLKNMQERHEAAVLYARNNGGVPADMESNHLAAKAVLERKMEGADRRIRILDQEITSKQWAGGLSSMPMTSALTGGVAGAAKVATYSGLAAGSAAAGTAALVGGAAAPAAVSLWGVGLAANSVREYRKISAIEQAHTADRGVDSGLRLEFNTWIHDKKRYYKGMAVNNSALTVSGGLLAAAMVPTPATPVLAAVGGVGVAVTAARNFWGLGRTLRAGFGRNPENTLHMQGTFFAESDSRVNKLVFTLRNMRGRLSDHEMQIRDFAADGGVNTRFDKGVFSQNRFTMRLRRMSRWIVPNKDKKDLRAFLGNISKQDAQVQSQVRSRQQYTMHMVTDAEIDLLKYQIAELTKERETLSKAMANAGRRNVIGPGEAPDGPLEALHLKNGQELARLQAHLQDMVQLNERLTQFGHFNGKDLKPSHPQEGWRNGAWPQGTANEWKDLQLDFILKHRLLPDVMSRKSLRNLEAGQSGEGADRPLQAVTGKRKFWWSRKKQLMDVTYPKDLQGLQAETRDALRAKADKYIATALTESMPNRVGYEMGAAMTIYEEMIKAKIERGTATAAA